MTVSNGTVHVDYEGTSGTSDFGINCPMCYTEAYTAFGVKCVVAPEIPNNAGTLDAVTVSAPENTIVNAPHPCAVVARSTIGHMMPDLVFGCLHQAMPDVVPAEGTSNLWNLKLGAGHGITARSEAEATAFMMMTFHSGGAGARPKQDGLSATPFPSGVRNVPVEISEAITPMVVWRKELREDSGGAGAQRGGLGQVMEITSREEAPFGIFASFKAQGALGSHADPTRVSRPFDKDRNGIVVSEGGCLFTMERLEDAQRRGARIYGEVVGHHVNSDAADFVLPLPERQNECMRAAVAKAGLEPDEIDLVNTHATSTPQGDVQECGAVRAVFGDSPSTLINNTKSYIGHTMGAAGALELAGNLPSLKDGIVHPSINVDNLDPDCELRGLVLGEPRETQGIHTILNLSFGMLGINSAVLVKSMA